MKRYFKLVKLLDSGKITVREFMERIEGRGRKIDIITASSLYRIYIEDGGRKYDLDDFLANADPDEVLDKIIRKEWLERAVHDDKLFKI